MPKLVKALSTNEVNRLISPGFHAVGGIPGLLLQVTDTGARSWVLRALIGGKRRSMGLGSFPAVPVADARQRAREARLLIDRGIDPIVERKEAKSALAARRAAEKTFAECVDGFLDAKSDEWRNSKHRAQWRSTLETYAYPVLRDMLVKDVELPHVLKVLEPIWKEKTETARRVRGRIENVLDWATVRGYREGLNPARWRGHLDTLLAAPKKIMKVEHHRALDVDAVPGFISSIRLQSGIGARALEFLVLTAARSGEVRGATWGEIDLASGTWTIPGERMKMNKEHRVPLSAPAVKLLAALPRVQDSNLVFPSAKGTALSDMALTEAMRRMRVDAVPHGFRSTFRDWASERTSYPHHVCEMALAHAIENKTEAAYRRGDLFDKRKKMMADWARFCDTPITKGGTVVPMTEKRAA